MVSSRSPLNQLSMNAPTTFALSPPAGGFDSPAVLVGFAVGALECFLVSARALAVASSVKARPSARRFVRIVDLLALSLYTRPVLPVVVEVVDRDRTFQLQVVIEKIVDAVRLATHREVNDHPIVPAALDVDFVGRAAGEGAGGLHRALLAGLRLLDHVKLALEHQAHGSRHVAVVEASRAGIELDEHLGGARPAVHVEDPVIAALGQKVLPLDRAGVETKGLRGRR